MCHFVPSTHGFKVNSTMPIVERLVGMEASAEAAHLARERERWVEVRTKIPYQTITPRQVTAMAEAEAREILDRQTW